MSTLTRRLTVIYSLTLTQARCLSILTLSGFCLSVLTPADSPPTYSHTIRLTAIHSHSQACCLSILSLSLRLAVCLFSHYQASAYLFSHHLAVYSHTSRLTAYLFSRYQARCLSILSLSLRLAVCLFSHYQASAYLFSHHLAVYSHTSRLTAYLFSHYQTHCHLFSLHQARCLSILSLSLRLAVCLFSHYQASAYLFSHHLAVYSHTSRLTAYLFSRYQTHCHLFSLHQARCLSILTLSGLLSSILTRSGSLSIYSHTQVTVYLFSHPMLLRYSCSLAHQCIRALSGSLPMYSRTQTSHLSSPTPRYLVPTIRFAAYLALVCCLASQTHHWCIIMLEYCSCSYPSSHSDLLPI